ncbi:FliG C-terminal domain-containing protein [Roseobacter sp. CCS2]|uniref:FliG C-terminal domain-containing protein n=1 Tax=Roseobacter sp. CCS2 TaxID=391593 RepID=UPI0000F40592|nr:FliG C-terminal domain-containing protein [Roseobacter sp. CCS2]EBA11411.1 flagellar motor switch protein FliG, putative [Roseobacter sp. CCS2]
MELHAAPLSDPPLSRRRKAAMIIQMLLEDGNTISLGQLPEQLQLKLTDELGTLRLVDKATVSAVAEEFTTELEAIGLTAPGTRDGAITTLADHLSPDIAKNLRSQLESVRNGDHWPIVTELGIERILAIMLAESTAICAITLSKLPVVKAAEVLSRTPGERARRITYAMSQTESIPPDAVRRIGSALAQEYGHPANVAFEKAPVQRLGAILNSTVTDTREDVLAGLNQEDVDFATNVRKAIFTFKDIAPRVKPTDIPNTIRNVDNDTLLTAIAAALKGDDALVASAEFILSSVSQRMATQLREDAEERGHVKKADAEKAMAAITTAIREMADAGVITLIDPDEADEEDDTNSE